MISRLFVFCSVFLAYFYIGVESHALCRDGTNSAPQSLTFCTEYSSASCCSVQTDADIQTRYNNLGALTPECAYHMKKTLCAECDPWSIHLIGDTATPKDVPWYCDGYCSQVYGNCSAQNMDQTYSPFNTNLISSNWPTFTDFSNQWCNDVSLSKNGGYCYNGVPFVPEERPVFNSNQGLCLSKIVEQDGTVQQYISLGAPNDGTNRVFLGGRTGIIRVFQTNDNATPVTLLGNFLDISAQVLPIVGEGGLLGMAFHPNYAANRKFYVSYTCDPTSHAECKWACNNTADCKYGGSCTGGFCSDHVLMSIIAEYTASVGNANVANPTENKRILQVSQPGANHKAGQIQFGTDGFLYINFGDGGGWGSQGSQNLNVYLGKILRIDINSAGAYNIPADNPFVGVAGLDEIWAYGFRNPWRSSIDFDTGSMWVGDVGQDTIEEVDLVVKGGNFGWRKYEGLTTFSPNDPTFQQVPPAAYYTHTGRTGACIIGGHVYRGPKDTCNVGRYVFADTEGELFSSYAAPSSDFFYSEISWKCGSPVGTSLPCTALTITRVFSFGEDASRNLYILAGNGIFEVVEQSRCPQLVCNATAAPQATTGVRVTTGSVSGTVSGGGTTGYYCAPPSGPTVSCNNVLAFRGGCKDLVCQVKKKNQ